DGPSAQAAAPPSGRTPRRAVSAGALAKPAARPVARLVPRIGALPADRDLCDHGVPVRHRLQPGDRRQFAPPRRDPDPGLPLAYAPSVALRRDAGAARDLRARRDPAAAGEALVGDPEALRVAAAALDGARARAPQPRAAGWRKPVRLRDRRAQHPALLPVQVHVRTGALLRRRDLPRRPRAAHWPEAAHSRARVPPARRAAAAPRPARGHGARAARRGLNGPDRTRRADYLQA